MIRLLCRSVFAAGWIFAAGCTASSTTVPIDTERRAAFEELGAFLKELAAEGRKPPSKLADLEAVEPSLPNSAPLIRSGEIVYVWGAVWAAGGTKVLAYESKMESEGGLALLQDGTVKSLTSAEFQSAGKAK